MAIGYNQKICSARDLAAMLNDIVGALDEGFIVSARPSVVRLENNDDLLVSWFEAGDSAYYTSYLLDGSDDEEWETQATSPAGMYRMVLTDDSIPTYQDLGLSGTPTAAGGYVVSNQFPEGWSVSASNNEHPSYRHQTIALHKSHHWLQIYHPDYQTVEDWRAHLAQYPLIVYVKIPE